MSDKLQVLLQGFFTDRLQRQRRASPHTIGSYRDTFRLLLRFAAERLHTPPAKLTLEELRAPFIGEFLQHLEQDRANSARSRNTRLAAIRSFFRYVALEEPSRALDCQRILAMPNKRYLRQPISFLEPGEIEAFLAAPDVGSRAGRRDRTLLLVAIQTGLRVSELAGLRCGDVELGAGAHVRCTGKGRRERHTPLRREVRATLAAWMRERSASAESPLFPARGGKQLSHDAIERIVTKYATQATGRCPSLKRKNVTPHVLRHTAAMELLRRGVDRTVIALWLGHESPETTGIYLHADLHMKEEALARTSPTGVGPRRYHPTDTLLAFLEGL
jgi:integrase/recombinase XerD